MDIHIGVGEDIEVEDLGGGHLIVEVSESARGKIDFMRSLSFPEKVKIWEALYP